MRWKNTETPTYAGSAGSNGKASVVETMQLLDSEGNEVAVFTKDITGTTTGKVGGVKRYVALLTQTSTDAPVATVLENTLGGTVVWSRGQAGVFTATLAGAFPATTTFCTVLNVLENGRSQSGFVAIRREDSDTLWLTSWLPGNGPAELEGPVVYTAADGMLTNCPVEIRVYP